MQSQRQVPFTPKVAGQRGERGEEGLLSSARFTENGRKFLYSHGGTISSEGERAGERESESSMTEMHCQRIF